MLLFLLLSCARTDEAEQEGPPPAPADGPELRLVPEVLDFGEQDVDQSRSLALIFYNDGDTDLFITDISAPDASGLEVGPPSSQVVVPGGQSIVDISWTTASVGTLTTELELGLSSPGMGSWTESVPVTGIGHGAVLVMSPREYDFDTVKVGCESGIAVSISNAGDVEIVVDDVRLDGTDAFSIQSGDVDDLPWTMAPFSTRSVNVKFAPDAVENDAAILELTTDQGTWSTVLEGSGEVDGEETLTYEVGSTAKAIAVWHVADCAHYAIGTSFDDSVGTLFETLNDNGASYRMVFLRTSDGIPQGGYDYIDETFSVSQATSTAIEMVSGGCQFNNDASFTTLFAGVDQAEDWMEDGDLWKEAKLSFVAINNDNDTSGGATSTYVEQAQKLREEPVKFHAIGENITGACNSSVPFTGYIEAVEETDGLFLNICDTDWDAHMEKLAAVIMNGSNAIFPLGGTPLGGSVEVKIDGVSESDGWSYDEGLNAVVFDDDAYPAQGAELEISYLTSNGC